jgi:hypothetical protein
MARESPVRPGDGETRFVSSLEVQRLVCLLRAACCGLAADAAWQTVDSEMPSFLVVEEAMDSLRRAVCAGVMEARAAPVGLTLSFISAVVEAFALVCGEPAELDVW